MVYKQRTFLFSEQFFIHLGFLKVHHISLYVYKKGMGSKNFKRRIKKKVLKILQHAISLLIAYQGPCWGRNEKQLSRENPLGFQDLPSVSGTTSSPVFPGAFRRPRVKREFYWDLMAVERCWPGPVETEQPPFPASASGLLVEWWTKGQCYAQ